MLSQCEFALNNSVHSGIEIAPFEVVFGSPAKLPIDVALKSLGDNKVQLVDDMIRARADVQ